MLELRGLRHGFGAAFRATRGATRSAITSAIALSAPDTALGADEHCALIGPSGSGKTTLLHILAGILKPTAGDVLLDGESLYSPPRGDRWRGARIGVVPQRLHLIGSLSALDNVRLAQHFGGTAAHDRNERGAAAAGDAARQRSSAAFDPDAAARAALAALGLEAAQHARPSALSVGQQQRVAIARAVINRPRLLLADEPTSSLDDTNAQRALDLLFDAAARSGALLVVATHDARIRERFVRRIELEGAA